jgi:hypothetical protein
MRLLFFLHSVQLLADDAAFEEALSTVGSGVVTDGEAVIRSLVHCFPTHIVQRARTMIRQQYECVKMPCPALDGGLATDQLMAYAGSSLASTPLLAPCSLYVWCVCA